MSDSIPALIAEARKLMADSEYGNRHDRSRMIESLVTALESLSSPPATDDALPERLEAQATFVPETRMADVMREAAEVIRAARRPSPVTREALEPLAELPTLIENALNSANRRDGDTDWALYRQAMRDPEVMRALYAVLMSRFSLPEPAEDEWCRDESCQYRHWRSGSMPTHKRGAGCPPPVPVKGTEQ